MRGFFLCSTGPGGDELRLAHALRAALPGAEVFAAAPDGPAVPAVAAAHAGNPLDPAALAAGARRAGDLVLVACPGGLLAPLTPRYSARDLAVDLGLPVVIAAPAGALNGARLTAEAARGAGLAVAAVILTRWPDPPSRVQLDERALLAELVGAPVLALPERDGEGAAAGWPVADWLEASPAAPPASGAPAPVPVSLDPYTAWEPRSLGDPRATPRPQIMAAMFEIVAAEGPMTATRAYGLYLRASGGKKLTSIARAPLSSSMYWLAQERKVVIVHQDEIPWQGDDVVRLPDSPAVRVRALGPRDLIDVPLDEVAALIGRLRTSRGGGDDELKRAVLTAYGLVRLTARADEYLGLALDLAAGQGASNDDV